MANRLSMLSERGRILAVVGAGHLAGIERSWNSSQNSDPVAVISELDRTPRSARWPRVLVGLIPVILIGFLGWMWYEGDLEGIGIHLGTGWSQTQRWQE